MLNGNVMQQLTEGRTEIGLNDAHFLNNAAQQEKGKEHYCVMCH